MKLRSRVALTTVAVLIPLIGTMLGLDAVARHDAAERALVEITRQRMSIPGERERCEADPAGWRTAANGHHRRDAPHGHGPNAPPGRRPPSIGPRGAPPRLTPHALTDAAAADVRSQGPSTWQPVNRRVFSAEVVVVVRMAWDEGPCAAIVTRGTTTPGFLGAILPASRLWLAPLVAVLVAVLVAIGPVVRRIRRLTAAVEASAAGGFIAPPTTEARRRGPMLGDDEVGALSHAFAGATAEVRRQLHARDERERALRDFLANTTHDVMIPLTVLTQHLAAMRADAEQGTACDPARLVAAMDEAHYLASLMHNLATTARVDVAEPQLERGPVDLNRLVARVCARHRPIAAERGIELHSGVPEATVMIQADLTLFEQAVSNLVYNAVRYNREGGHVAITVDRIGEGDVEVRVLDDGPGIAPAELVRLVERGYRGDEARGRGGPGQGLGLHITQTVARLHGFVLTFTNRPEGGLEVTLRGPHEPDGAPAADAADST